VPIRLRICLDRGDQLTIFRHKDLLHNLGIHGNDFVKQNEGIVIEMTCKFLEYVTLYCSDQFWQMLRCPSQTTDRYHLFFTVRKPQNIHTLYISQPFCRIIHCIGCNSLPGAPIQIHKILKAVQTVLQYATECLLSNKFTSDLELADRSVPFFLPFGNPKRYIYCIYADNLNYY
jgi:hypothetical protein